MTDMKTPFGHNILVYDLEIIVAIDPPRVTWTDYDKMGISVGVVYSFLTGDYTIFLPGLRPSDSGKMIEMLLAAQMIVGFNVHGFDNPLLAAQMELGCGDERYGKICNLSYDLLRESRLSMGWRPGTRYPKNMRLDHHLEAMFGEHFKKTEDASEAPAIYASGDIGRVISYCISDVRREANLFDRVWRKGHFKTKLHGEQLVCRPPQKWGTTDWDDSLDWSSDE